MPLRSASAQGKRLMFIALAAAMPFGQTAAIEGAKPRDLPNAAIHLAIADSGIAEQDDSAVLISRRLIVPVAGIARASLRDTFTERRGPSLHEAIDIAAPRGTPVVAAGEGRIVKLFNSVPGGHTIYQFDPDQKFAYYYAHLDAYADGVKEGMPVKRGDVLGYVGTSGNAPPDAPHLHFAIFRLGPEHHWWQGTPINPYGFLNEPER
jgi:murein DD-endopeptidase MepM/ murein hydrolase activator NlpD